MKYAVIENGIVENVIEADSKFRIEGKTLIQSNTAGRGDLYDGQNFTRPEPQPVIREPSDIEVRLSALEAKAGITEQDKEAAREELRAK